MQDIREVVTLPRDRSIVIASRFSVKTPTGGTRGSTPGRYVERYMDRPGAVEACFPLFGTPVEDYAASSESRGAAVRLSPDVDSAVASASVSRDGTAFSRDSLSMSYDDVREASSRIQRDFEDGKTVFETVLSFDDDFLRDVGVLDDAFRSRGRGSHRGHVDQMRLRVAVSEGLSDMGRRFDDLYWVGVFHLDTEHMHCHLAMVDEGEGQLHWSGEQKGVITDRDLTHMQGFVRSSLERTSQMACWPEATVVGRTRVRAAVREYVHDAVDVHGMPQVILAALPHDPAEWSLGAESGQMAHAEALTRAYVGDVLSDPRSGYADAVMRERDLAETAGRRAGWGPIEVEEDVRRRVRVLQDDCVEGVWDALREIPENERVVSSPYLDIMAEDLYALADRAEDDPMADFGYRLRSYGSRLDFHRGERRRFARYAEEYESVANPAPEAAAALEFYRFEERYQAMCMAKYQLLMEGGMLDEDLDDEVESLRKSRETLLRESAMGDSLSGSGLVASEAERYGREAFGLPGGAAWVVDAEGAASGLQARLEAWDADLRGLQDRAVDFGRRIVLSDEGITCCMRVEHHVAYDFDEVRALDIHHMRYDFPGDAGVSRRCADEFSLVAAERSRLLSKAVDYFERSGQGWVRARLPERDVEAMVEVAEAVGGSLVLESARTPEVGPGLSVRTTEIDPIYDEAARDRVFAVVRGRSVEEPSPSIA